MSTAETMDSDVVEVYTWNAPQPPEPFVPDGKRIGLVVVVGPGIFVVAGDRNGRLIQSSQLPEDKDLVVATSGHPIEIEPGSNRRLALVEIDEFREYFRQLEVSNEAVSAVRLAGGEIIADTKQGTLTARLPVRLGIVEDQDRAELALRDVNATYGGDLIIPQTRTWFVRNWARHHPELVRPFLGISDGGAPADPRLLDIYIEAVSALMWDRSVRKGNPAPETVPVLVNAAEALGTITTVLPECRDSAYRDALLERWGEVAKRTAFEKEVPSRLQNHSARIIFEAVRWHLRGGAAEQIRQHLRNVEVAHPVGQSAAALQEAFSSDSFRDDMGAAVKLALQSRNQRLAKNVAFAVSALSQASPSLREIFRDNQGQSHQIVDAARGKSVSADPSPGLSV